MADQGGELVVRYSSLQTAHDDIKKAAGVIERELEAMRAAVNQVAAGWHGEAHQMMLQVDAEFRKRSAHIQTTLKQVADLVLKGGEHFHATDKKASQLFDISY
ncbi:WXG100 family type VII secretion target [Streptomyces roseoverticillatus]|uniref:WXG100 family type VII secretion target n=1 Tax=Streptomyces roseoverticillatus TaxID=66429 RepID=UPI001F276D1F|nr:WXG100 family type VII secretion target [Streptomyces roseoverticillatus]MCF3106625.1 WXG100 family type VII secretion target [Streptomyces roseoverticillatus]